MSIAHVFLSDTVSFIYHEAYPGIPDIQNDTVVIHSSHYESDCHGLPFGTNIYLGFRFKDERDYLGWFRLILQEPARITLKEFAVQEELIDRTGHL
jgi:hypothetical protein